jgi:hypothetical protein
MKKPISEKNHHKSRFSKIEGIFPFCPDFPNSSNSKIHVLKCTSQSAYVVLSTKSNGVDGFSFKFYVDSPKDEKNLPLVG